MVSGGVHRVHPFHEVDQYPCSKVPSESCICSGVWDQGVILELSNVGVDFFGGARLFEAVGGQPVDGSWDGIN